MRAVYVVESVLGELRNNGVLDFFSWEVWNDFPFQKIIRHITVCLGEQEVGKEFNDILWEFLLAHAVLSYAQMIQVATLKIINT